MKKTIVCLFGLLMFFNAAIAQQTPPLKSDYWKGFDRVHFLIGTHPAYVVKPVKALPGNPWVWRASFPDWHTDIDSILLRKGFYVAYVSFDDQYGSPAAMQVWDKFYNLLTDSLKLSSRPALEAVSRGNLYAFGWAKRNPDKVSCIYTETPIYDMKSWPGGKGKGVGDPECWKQLKEVYHLTEEQAMAYKDNPVDNLEGLAAFKVPVLNVIGLNDKIAPRGENTDIFVQRYTALGGPAAIYPVADGPQELQGHHFPIRHPDHFADFIFCNSYPVKKILPYIDYINTRGGIANFYKTILKNKKATVAFLGGSITFNPGWRQMICAYLQERFPDTHFHFIAAGIPSLGSLAHSFRLQRDVLDSGKVDLMFVEAAVNDRGSGVDSATQMHSLEGIVRHARKSNPSMDMIFMEFADTYKNNDYDKGVVPGEVFRHEAVAIHYNLPSINLAKEVHDKIRNGEFDWNNDFKDIHPAPLGEELYFENIKKFLELSFNRIPVDLKITEHALTKPTSKYSFEDGHYDDVTHAQHDANWTYNSNWTPSNHESTRDGFVNVPMLTTEAIGATLKFPFTGNAVGIAVISGDDTGIISYSIDNSAPQRLDLYTEFSNWLYLPYYQLLGKDLKNSKHILTIKMEKDKNPNSKGNACRIVHFLVNG